MTSPESFSQAFPDDLTWQAFLYVSGELTPDEIVDFEERLLSDQSAREAVANAVKLADGVCAASLTETAVSADSPSRRKRSAGWLVWTVGSVLAASLAFFVGWWMAGPNTNSSDRIIAESNSDPNPKEADLTEIEGAGQLLAFWADSKSLLADSDEVGPSADDSAELSEDMALRESNGAEEEFAWMLSAVSSTPANPPVMEN